MAVETWLLLGAVLVLAWIYSRWRHSYWASRGVTSPPCLPFIGHLHKSLFIDRKSWLFYKEVYYKYGGSSFCGLYEMYRPILVTGDPEVMKHIYIKDFDHFTDRRTFTFPGERDRIIQEMLSVKNGPEWKSLRAIMTPTFTSGKIKNMFHLVCDKADVLVNYSIKEAAKKQIVDMKENCGRYTMDTIASCAFGIECNSMEDETAEFPRKVEVFFKPNLKGILKGIAFICIPKVCALLKININPPELDFFADVIKKTVAVREAGEARGDFLDLMLEARDNSDSPNSKYVLNNKCLVAQSVLFIIAGYDTTANALAFACFLLAKNKDQQQRVREEVQKMTAEHGGFTYQGIMEAKLLDACIQEVLRIYPPATLLERSCSKTYRIPGTDLTLKPGDLVQTPIWGIHHDPKYWPNPEEFQPERFLPENKDNIQPLTHIPFGIGPRNCIAMRFALLEAKVALAKVLLKVELNTAPGHETVETETVNGLLRPKNGVHLLLKPLLEE